MVVTRGSWQNLDVVYDLIHALNPLHRVFSIALQAGTRHLSEQSDSVPLDLVREIVENRVVRQHDEFVTHFALSRQVEWDLWAQWLSAHVSEWELRRYFEVT